MISLASRARALYDKRHYPELVELLAPIRSQLVETSPYLAFYLADAWRRLARQTDALELVSELRATSKRAGIPRLELDRLNLAGMLCFETGDMEGAENEWRELLRVAAEEKSEDFVARANNNLGIIYTLAMRTEEALMSYQRALGAYQVLGSIRGLAQSHQNLAILFREMEHFADADSHFEEAIRLARVSESEDEIARAEQERALLIYLRDRDVEMSRITAKRAIGRFTVLQDAVGASDSQRVLAMIELGEGDVAGARAHSEQALQAARKVGHALLEAELLEVLAAIARKSGALENALELEREADAVFEKLHARGWGRQQRALIQRIAAE